MEEGSITLQPCIDFVDEWITVEEVDIARAMLDMWESGGIKIEGVIYCSSISVQDPRLVSATTTIDDIVQEGSCTVSGV